MISTEIAVIVGPAAVLVAATIGALINKAATGRAARRAAAVAWSGSHVKDQHKAVTDFLSDPLSADTNGATLNLRFLAPTPEIRDTALRIQALDKVLAAPEPEGAAPGALEFGILHMLAEVEQWHEEDGNPFRDLRDQIVRFYIAQRRALERGEPGPDESALLGALTTDGMEEASAKALLSYGGARDALEAERVRARAAHQSAAAEREQLHARLAGLMAAWVATPPG
ncbi:hypothetical protein AB0D46_30885 [Streptomyces sp. NPDC048383]|uniref:hypothetical protein n=1 Tax=Streptomyces sp. NPDC048383 TaxID=3155386 RepID=UPI0034262C09